MYLHVLLHFNVSILSFLKNPFEAQENVENNNADDGMDKPHKNVNSRNYVGSNGDSFLIIITIIIIIIIIIIGRTGSSTPQQPKSTSHKDSDDDHTNGI